jgi:hypothetical protein
MLALLIRQRFGEVSRSRISRVPCTGISWRSAAAGAAAARPRELATTYIYLDHLAGCQDTVDTAVDELLAGIDPPQALQAAA